MKNLLKIILAVFVLVIIGGVFYWYEWRPGQIRKECQRNIENIGHRDALEEQVKIKLGGGEEIDLYQNCLREHGLEK